jgi:SAM-dependent methyltransferase/uncharacterized protein YbaR (Trm112 family)
MDRGLLDLLVDPETGAPLKIDWLRGDPGEEVGILRAPDGSWYPIVRGIPRLVTGEVRTMVFDKLASELQAIGAELPPEPGRSPTSASTATDDETRLVRRTAASFGYEWTHWGTMLPEYEEVARHYFEPLGSLEFGGRLLLDVGCGSGRQAHYAHRWGARVVGMDLSEAIEVAARNVPPSGSLFVQADVRKPPFRPGTFDDVVSFGVLHHLPDPEAGFDTVRRLARPGGRVLVYLYHAFEGQPVKRAGRVVFDAMRRVTTRLPHGAMRPLAHGLGAVFTVAFVVPARMLRQRPSGRRLSAARPFASYVDLPFRVIVNDQFDRFATPIENRYRRDEVAAWFERANLRDVRILGNGGWRASGSVPEGEPGAA